MSDLITRRRALQLALAGLTGAGCATRLYAAPADAGRFLLVFLRGGYDASNALVPYSSSFYYEARPNIAIAPPDAARASGALALDASWALAPALRDSLAPLWQQRQLAFVPFAGTADLTRSHFETQDSIELGQPLNGARDYRSGFLARLHAALRPPGGAAVPAIAFTDALPLSFQGREAIPNISLKGVGKPPFDDRQVQILSGMYAGQALEPAVAGGLELRRQVAQTLQQLDDEMRSASRNAVSIKGFELEAERIARLMRDDYRLGFVDIGGWDTHVNEGGAQGALASNLAGLGRGLTSFAQALGTEWRNTVVVVLSEFGRTFRENGNRGTDHGHGSVYWVLGGSLNGARIAGEQQALERVNLFQDRDYPVLNDYRALLGGLFRRQWGLTSAQCAQVFPQVTPLDLQLT
jgi:uncharacterized protein (DUF1501 family)